MAITIFTKRAFEFENSDGEKVQTKRLEFKTVPEWVKETPLFALGVKDGSIQSTQTAKEQTAAENAVANTPKVPEAPAKDAKKTGK